jgi:hypothetical protein
VSISAAIFGVMHMSVDERGPLRELYRSDGVMRLSFTHAVRVDPQLTGDGHEMHDLQPPRCGLARPVRCDVLFDPLVA